MTERRWSAGSRGPGSVFGPPGPLATQGYFSNAKRHTPAPIDGEDARVRDSACEVLHGAILPVCCLKEHRHEMPDLGL